MCQFVQPCGPFPEHFCLLQLQNDCTTHWQTGRALSQKCPFVLLLSACISAACDCFTDAQMCVSNSVKCPLLTATLSCRTCVMLCGSVLRCCCFALRSSRWMVAMAPAIALARNLCPCKGAAGAAREAKQPAGAHSARQDRSTDTVGSVAGTAGIP